MALFTPEELGLPDRTPNSRLIVGSEGSDAEQSGSKLVTRGGAGSAQADVDIDSHDVSDTDYESDIRDIGGTSVLNFALDSEEGNTFEVKIEYYADDEETVVRTWDSSVFSQLEGASVDTTIPVAGDLIDIIITDTSGAADNHVSGSINANVGSSTVGIDVDLQAEAVGVNNSNGNRIDPATAALEAALKSNDTDEFVSRIAGDNGNEITDSPMNIGVDDADVAILTYIGRALNDVGIDELVSRITNSSGDQIDPATDALEGALKSEDTDELISRITNSNGSEVDPATTALEGALKSEDTDEFVTRLAGSDGQEIVEQALDSAVAAGDVALLTYLSRALNSVGQDQLISRITDSGGNQIDPSTAALEGALKSNDSDEFVSRIAGTDGIEVQEEALNSGVSAGDVALLTYLARALNTVGQDELVSRVTNSSGAQIDPATEGSLTSEQPRKKTLGDNGTYNNDTVGTAQSQLLDAEASRRSLLIQNLGSQPIYIGFDNGVTTDNGIRLGSDGGKYSDDTYTGAIHAISGSDGQDVRVQEVTD